MQNDVSMPNEPFINSVPPPLTEKRRAKRSTLLFSAVVTIGVYTYLFSHISLSEVVEVAKKADLRGVFTFLVLSMSMNVFRTWRYDLVLRSSGYATNRIGLFLVVVVRNLFSDLLPARVGSLIYVYLVNQRLGIPIGPTTSSFVLPFFFDIIAVAPLIILAALFIDPSTGQSPSFFIGGGIVLIVLMALFLFFLPRGVHRTRDFLSNSPRFSDSLRQRLTAVFAEAEEEILCAKRSGIYLQLFLLSLMVRLTKYGALYIFLFALTAPFGYEFRDLHLPKVFLGLCAAELAASLPISGIGGFGAYEGTWAVVFAQLGFPQHMANLTAVSHHLFTQVYGYITGALAMALLFLPCFGKHRAQPLTGTFTFPLSRFSYSLAFVTVLVAGCALTVFHVAGFHSLTTRDPS